MAQGDAEKEDLRRRLEEVKAELSMEQESREVRGGTRTNGLLCPGGDQEEEEKTAGKDVTTEVVQTSRRVGRKSRRGRRPLTLTVHSLVPVPVPNSATDP